MPFRDLTEEKFTTTEYSNTEFVDVKKYGAKGDGTTDDSAAMTTAINEANGATLLLPVGIYKLSGNVIVPSNVAIRFINGAKLSIDSGIAFTINGKLDTGLYQIFSGAGSVFIAKGSVIHLLPQWWGAVGDGTNDDTSAIQSAIDCALAGGIKKVFLSAGTYKTTSALNITGGVHLIGSGKNISEIMVTGGGNGINVTRGGSAGIWEGTKLSDFRIYSTKIPIEGAGISITGDRSVDVDNVHVGGWYAGTSGGFIYGVYVTDQPAYYTTVRRCALFRNTYGVYINAGANESRIIDNEIWWGDYGVYLGAPQAQVKGNSIEGYAIAGVISSAEEHIIDNNRFESIGIPSVILNPGSHMASITNSHGQTGLGDNGPVVNLSGKNNHRIGNSFIPVGQNSTMGFPAGAISGGDIANWHQRNVHIESYMGDLTLKSGSSVGSANISPKSIVAKSQLDISKPSFSSPIVGIGTSAENLFEYSDIVNLWYPNIYGGTVTIEGDAAVGADGYSTNAVKALSIGDSNNAVGMYITYPTKNHLYQFSVWLRADTKHQITAYLWENNTPLNVNYFMVGTEWQRFTMFALCDDEGLGFIRAILRLTSGYPLYIWGPQMNNMKVLLGTDNSGVDSKAKVMDSTVDFIKAGIDIGGLICISEANSYNVYGIISDIRSTIDFNTGTGLAPAVGTIITGGNSSATGVITDVVITSGTFAGNDATGYLEVNSILGTFTTENITFAGGSCSCTDANLNDVLYFGTLYPGHGDKVTVNNGDNYAVCSSSELGFKPYIPTNGSSIIASTTPVLVAPKIYSNGTIKAAKGFVRGIAVFDPMDQNFTTSQGIEYYFISPIPNRILYVHDGTEGHIFTVVNTGSNTLLVYHYSGGVLINVAPGEETTWVYTGGAWRIQDVKQTWLRKIDDVTFNSLITTNKVSGKTINGAVKPLTNQATIACDMNEGNVFTLSTTDAVGAVTINASNGTAGQTVTFIITDDSTGGHVVTFGTNFKSKGTLTGTSDKTATISFVYDGTNWYEFSRITGL